MTNAGLSTLVETLLSRPPETRTLVALAGPPGAGKSTIVEDLSRALDAAGAGSAQIVPMDGFHLDNRVLDQKGLTHRKGAPETYDVLGLVHLLERLRRNNEGDIFIPVFDRTIELSRAAAASVPQDCRFVVIEGNYLLLNRPVWESLRAYFDVTVMITASEETLKNRLTARWQSLGLDPGAITAKVEHNDLPNARLVLQASAKADLVLKT